MEAMPRPRPPHLHRQVTQPRQKLFGTSAWVKAGARELGQHLARQISTPSITPP